jgi:tetratricopeptide (TPR) repeat protein
MLVTLLKKILPLALLLLSGPLTARADLEQAEKLFQSGEVAKALQAYKGALAAQPDRGALPPTFYFNYGTVAAKAGNPGEAYVALTRAAFTLPFDSDVRHNLKIVEAQLPANVLTVQPSQWMQWWPKTLRTLPWKLWLLLALIASAAAFALRRVADRTLAVTAGLLSGALFLWGGLAWYQARVPVFGITVITKVKSGPGSTFSDILQLEPGSLVNEETVRDGWLKIRFTKSDDAEESVGWVEPGSALQIL